MAVNDLYGFGRRIRVMSNRAIPGATEAVQSCAVAVATELVESTPIDTGRAISNWDAAVGNKTQGYVQAKVPGKKGSSRGASVAEAISRMTAKIRGYQAGKTASINITNNAPYIGLLNAGSSTQAPAGFIEKAIQRGRQAIGNVRIFR